MRGLDSLKVKIFADGAKVDEIFELARDRSIKGFTTNPTLMRAAGVADYEAFARQIVAQIDDRPVSFGVLADDLDAIEDEARNISAWGENVFVKVPVTNTRGEFTGELISRLARSGVKLNVTALLTPEQVRAVAAALDPGTPSIVSVFAGRIADTGIDPVPVMSACVEILAPLPQAELLWASPRELLNVFHADECGCHIITVTPDLLGKLSLIGKDLTEYSLETVEMFHRDAVASGYHVAPGKPQAAE